MSFSFKRVLGSVAPMVGVVNVAAVSFFDLLQSSVRQSAHEAKAIVGDLVGG